MTSSAASDAAGKTPTRAGFRLPRAARLRKVREIRRTMRRGRRTTSPLVDVFSIPSPAGRSRVGVIVPRHGQTSVARNRVRRRLSEIARTGWLPRLDAERRDLDVILRAKPAAYGASYDRLRESLAEPLEGICAR